MRRLPVYLQNIDCVEAPAAPCASIPWPHCDTNSLSSEHPATPQIRFRRGTRRGGLRPANDLGTARPSKALSSPVSGVRWTPAEPRNRTPASPPRRTTRLCVPDAFAGRGICFCLCSGRPRFSLALGVASGSCDGTVTHFWTFSFSHLACGQFCSSRRVGPTSLRLVPAGPVSELIEGADPNGEGT
jgi:hypothetical protein